MAETSEHHIKTTKTARYFTMGTFTEQTKHVWLVLHGYGQLGEYFIKNFKAVQHAGNFIVAPDALSRYYLNETTGRIGASWMTKEDRENEIEDYLNYLDLLMGELKIPNNCEIHVLGFSQGAATACRWALHTGYPIKTLVSWAGFFPPDMQWNSPKYLSDDMKTYLLYGLQDEYVNEELKKQMEKVMLSLKKKPNILTFEGRHEIVESILFNLVKTVEKK